jgi:DNA-binding IclR family transcriptional regulator
MADILFLPEGDRHFVNWLQRHPNSTLAEIIAQVGDEQTAQEILERLQQDGYITETQQDGQVTYRLKLKSMRGQRSR